MNLEYRSGRYIDFDVGDAKRAPIFWPPLDESGRGDQQQQRDEETCAAAISWPCFVAMCYRYQSIAKQTAETSTTDFVIFQQMHGLLGHLSRILSRPLLTIDLIPGNFMSIFYHYSTFKEKHQQDPNPIRFVEAGRGQKRQNVPYSFHAWSAIWSTSNAISNFFLLLTYSLFFLKIASQANSVSGR